MVSLPFKDENIIAYWGCHYSICSLMAVHHQSGEPPSVREAHIKPGMVHSVIRGLSSRPDQDKQDPVLPQQRVDGMVMEAEARFRVPAHSELPSETLPQGNRNSTDTCEASLWVTSGWPSSVLSQL